MCTVPFLPLTLLSLSIYFHPSRVSIYLNILMNDNSGFSFGYDVIYLKDLWNTLSSKLRKKTTRSNLFNKKKYDSTSFDFLFLLFLSPEKTSPYSSSKTVTTPQNKDTVWGVVICGPLAEEILGTLAGLGGSMNLVPVLSTLKYITWYREVDFWGWDKQRVVSVCTDIQLPALQ